MPRFCERAMGGDGRFSETDCQVVRADERACHVRNTLRHASISTADIYLRTDDDQRHRAFDASQRLDCGTCCDNAQQRRRQRDKRDLVHFFQGIGSPNVPTFLPTRPASCPEGTACGSETEAPPRRTN